jgi:DNA-binding transcriptional regulator YiaG
MDNADLPPPDVKRWVATRKAAVILAIRKGSISTQEACARYNISAEELAQWERDLDRYGVPGLRITRLQIYRETSKPK